MLRTQKVRKSCRINSLVKFKKSVRRALKSYENCILRIFCFCFFRTFGSEIYLSAPASPVWFIDAQRDCIPDLHSRGRSTRSRAEARDCLAPPSYNCIRDVQSPRCRTIASGIFARLCIALIHTIVSAEVFRIAKLRESQRYSECAIAFKIFNCTAPCDII